VKSTKHSPTIIIGGGIAGLLAANKLQQNGQGYSLFEAKSQLGGRILADDQSDQGIDLGPTWLFTHQPKIQALMHKLRLSIFAQFVEGDALFEAPEGTVSQLAGTPTPQMYRVAGGMYRVIECLKKQLKAQCIMTSQHVSEVKRAGHKWQLKVNDQIFTSDQLILALPPRMIAAHLTPEHWADQHLQSRLSEVPTWMAAQAKFVIKYARPFWRDRGLSGQAFSRRGPMVEMHDACDDGGNNAALFGFIGVPATQRALYTKAQIIEACIAQLVNLYGEQAGDYQYCDVKDWAQDRWVCTKTDISEPAAHPHIDLKPFAQQLTALNLCLVGSEFAECEAGYLEGAIEAVEVNMESLHL
jgi:monoamine oxidase